MFRFTSFLRTGLPAIAFGVGLLTADPPSAMVRSQVQVPGALHSGVFGQDRFLNLPPGFQISLFAKVSGARFLAIAPNGDVLVSQPGSGRITLLRPDPVGGVPAQFAFATGLNNAQGIVFQTIGSTTYLYVSEAHQVSRYVYLPGDTKAHDRQVVVTGLPDGGNHPLKNIAFDSDGKLYVAIASSCNVCTSDTTSSPQRAAIYVYNADGSGARLFAQGLRNAEGLAFLPGTRQLFVVMNNRDDLPYPVKDASGNYGKLMASYVDNHPPDLFTSVRDGGNYGWPFCNSNPDNGLDRMPFDPDYDVNRDSHVNCGAMDLPDKGIQAHSAPLGLSLLQGTTFATPYRNGAVLGLHGSWDRSTPTGYKVTWYSLSGGRPGAATDLVTGWLDDVSHSAWGRPVAAVADAAGGLLISDDSAGAIYRLTYAPTTVSAASNYALLAPESLASIYGDGLAGQTLSADSAQWPTSLGGVSVTVQDSQGTSRPAPLAYVSSNQVNVQIPAGTATGSATLTVQGPGSIVKQGVVTIAAAAPGLFDNAATGIRLVVPSNIQSPVSVYDCSNGGVRCVPIPIALGIDTPIYLSFFGTGIRGLSSLSKVQMTIGGVATPVAYAGPQGTWPGLDQVNVALPVSLRGAGLVDAVLTVDGRSSNAVQIAIQ